MICRQKTRKKKKDHRKKSLFLTPAGNSLKCRMRLGPVVKPPTRSVLVETVIWIPRIPLFIRLLQNDGDIAL